MLNNGKSEHEVINIWEHSSSVLKCFFLIKHKKINFILFSVCSSTFACMTDLNIWTQMDTVSSFILTVCPWFGLSIGSQMCARYYGDFVVCCAFLLTHTWKVWSNLHPVQFIGLTLIFKPFWKQLPVTVLQMDAAISESVCGGETKSRWSVRYSDNCGFPDVWRYISCFVILNLCILKS